MRKHKGIHNPSLSRILMSAVFCFSMPLLVLAQGQQPPVLIDFEQFSAPVDQWGPPSTLNVGSATFLGWGLLRNQTTWSLDQTNVFVNPWPTLDSPGSQQPADSCPQRGSGNFGPNQPLEIDFHEKVSNFSALLLNSSGEFGPVPLTYTVCDDQGGSEQITLPGNGGGTIFLPDSGIRRVDIFPTNDYTEPAIFAIDNVRFTPIDPVLLDPVDSGFLSGAQVTANTGLLASGGTVITGVAADGVTQAVVRILANTVGETLSVTVQDENGNPCSGENGVANDGGVFALGDSSQSADCNLDVPAVATTSDGPMAFVVYLSPVNYARSSGDYNSASRTISLKIQSDDDPNYMLTANASVVRPPVVLVHGLWGSAADWQNFYLPINGLTETPLDYYQPLLLGVTATNPTYPLLPDIPTSALGFSYNAPLVDGQIREDIGVFRRINNAAAVTADVVAHSMGGDIVRTEAGLGGFLNNDTYGHGPINKLITIGTPHLGSPLATDLLQDASWCVRDALAVKKKASLITVTTSAGPPINGAVGDLQGDGFGGGLSPALNTLFYAGPLPFHIALISAVTQGGSNLNNLNCTVCWAHVLKLGCNNSQVHDPLAIALTPTGWDTLFGQYNDAVVPKLSELNGGIAGPNVPTLMGVIHSQGLTSLDFLPPTELDQNSGVPGQVVNLLNEPPSGPDFR
jgi:pimeloyl-ACP methyl ester carboxylesterase